MQKLTKPEALAIARRFIEAVLPAEPWYRQCRPEVKALVLYGSTAKGLNRPDSDIDILCFMPLALEEAHTAGEYFYHFAGREINIVIRSIERLRRITKEQSDTFQQEVFRGSVVLWTADDEVPHLLDRIAVIGATPSPLERAEKTEPTP